MADWATTGIFDGGNATIGPAVTPGATANTKGSYTSFGTYTTPSFGVWLTFGWMQAITTARTILFDVAVGSAGSEVVVIPDIAACPGSVTGGQNSRAHTSCVFVPVYIPAGEIRVRAQTNVASHSSCFLVIRRNPYQNSAIGSVITAYGVDSANSRGVTVTASNTEGAYGSWAEITASTARRMRGMDVMLGHGNSWLSAYSDQWHGFDIGIGPSGQEVTIARFNDGGVGSYHPIPTPSHYGFFEVDIPEGTRLSARLRVQDNSATQRTRSLIIYGVN